MALGIILFFGITGLIILVATFCKVSEVSNNKQNDQHDKEHSFLDW